MKSFRFQFIDLDESYSISTARTEISGYIGIRAPKGTKEATLFTQGNEKHIRAMIGIPTAHWPDIAEAIAFNNGYDLYISAPPGNSAEYPSYYGGKYITRDGVLDYWRVSDADNPSFEVGVPFGSESDYIESLSDSDVDLSIDSGELKVSLSNIPKKVFERTNFIDYNGTEISIESNKLYTGSSTDKKEVGSYNKETKSASLKVGKIIDILGIDALPTIYKTIKLYGKSFAPTTENTSITPGDFYCSVNEKYFIINNNAYTIGDSLAGGFIQITEKITLDDISSNTVYLSKESGTVYYLAKGTDGEYGWEALSESGQSFTIPVDEIAKNYAWNGNDTPYKEFGEKYIKAFKGLKDTLLWKYNIKADTLLCVSQKSPYETKTKFTISDIGYDKYLYDLKVPYVTSDWFDGTYTDSEGSTAATKNNKDKLKNNFESISPYNGIIAVAEVNTASDEAQFAGKFELWAQDENGLITKVTDEYITKDVYIYKAADISSIDSEYDPSAAYDIASEITGTIWYVDNTTSGVVFKQRTDDGELLLRGNVNFNTVTISCSEEVEPGEVTTGGEFTGSLSETGTDVNGTNIYFPNVLSEDSVTFIKVIPVNTIDSFDEYKNGFWQGLKIVDEAIDGDVYATNIKGQRYCSYVNRKNIADGKLGCAWRNEYQSIINDSLIEAESDTYDDCIIFMEPTGQEAFRSKLVSLRESCHDLSTFISPKIITQAEFDNPNKIIINGKSFGVAQYIGEFKMYDTYTGKYYYCQPIGDVGLMLARINDREYGGHAPAGTNVRGLGGQLSRAVLEAKWKFKDSQLKILNTKGVNPITYDSKFGLMMRDHLSTADNSNGSDWGWLGHSMSFDLCKREIRDNVMAEQLFKRINAYYMSIRQKQIEAILDKRTTGNDPIWDYAYCNISGVNNGTTKTKKQFVIEVGCRVNVYSESVLLYYKTLSQE